ncbi:hypothetical protein PM082_012959 [Marasmius tenuissimus]|nr:hypothetical protein PM082_012959 [Marasmius tenuissimus]
MEYSTVFLRARAVAFSGMAFISFTWTVLLTVVLSLQWSMIGTAEKSFIGVMIVLNLLTMILLLLLLVLKFRPWLDGARCLFLLVTHLTTAGGYASMLSKFRCPGHSADQEGTCELMAVYILIASWVIPLLVLIYTGGLLLMVYRRKKLQKATGKSSEDEHDIEKRLSDGSSSGGSNRSHDSFFSPPKHQSTLFDPAKMVLPARSSVQTTERSDGSSRNSYTPVSSARHSHNPRLSVPSPARISQPMLLVPSNTHHHHHHHRSLPPPRRSQPRMTWTAPPPVSIRTSHQGLPPPRAARARASTMLSKPSRHDHL